jgi:hypothetical protein
VNWQPYYGLEAAKLPFVHGILPFDKSGCGAIGKRSEAAKPARMPIALCLLERSSVALASKAKAE